MKKAFLFLTFIFALSVYSFNNMSENETRPPCIIQNVYGGTTSITYTNDNKAIVSVFLPNGDLYMRATMNEAQGVAYCIESETNEDEQIISRNRNKLKQKPY